MKALKLTDNLDNVIAIVDNATQALKAAEKYSCCSLVTKLHGLTAELREGKFASILNCQDGRVYVETIEGDAKSIQREKQYHNAMKTAALFN